MCVCVGASVCVEGYVTAVSHHSSCAGSLLRRPLSIISRCRQCDHGIPTLQTCNSKHATATRAEPPSGPHTHLRNLELAHFNELAAELAPRRGAHHAQQVLANELKGFLGVHALSESDQVCRARVDKACEQRVREGENSVSRCSQASSTPQAVTSCRPAGELPPNDHRSSPSRHASILEPRACVAVKILRALI